MADYLKDYKSPPQCHVKAPVRRMTEEERIIEVVYAFNDTKIQLLLMHTPHKGKPKKLLS